MSNSLTRIDERSSSQDDGGHLFSPCASVHEDVDARRPPRSCTRRMTRVNETQVSSLRDAGGTERKRRSRKTRTEE